MASAISQETAKLVPPALASAPKGYGRPGRSSINSLRLEGAALAGPVVDLAVTALERVTESS